MSVALKLFEKIAEQQILSEKGGITQNIKIRVMVLMHCTSLYAVLSVHVTITLFEEIP